MTETLSRGPSNQPDFSDQLAALMRGAGKEETQQTDPAAEWTTTPDELPTVSEAAETESYSQPDSQEESPIFAQLKAEQAGNVVTGPAESNVDQSASRIGNLLRGTADVADATAEKVSDGKEFAKSKLRSFGRAALRAARASRELGAGVKVLAGSAAKRGLEAAGTKVAESYNNAIDKGMESLDKGADFVGDKMNDLKEGVKEKLIARRNAALGRRQVRRERWSQRLTSAKEAVTNTYDKSGDALLSGFAKIETGADIVGTKMVNAKDKVTDKVERTRSTAASLRAIGRVAIDNRRS